MRKRLKLNNNKTIITEQECNEGVQRLFKGENKILQIMTELIERDVTSSHRYT